MSTSPVTLAIPKGSLEDTTLGLLNQAGLPTRRVGGSLRLSPPMPGIEPILLRPQEIPMYVADGLVDCGLTGYDWLAEQECDTRVEVLARLRYSKMQTVAPIRWVLAVDASSPVRTVADLRKAGDGHRLRVATELPNVTRAWLEREGVEADITRSWGATEAKVPLLADAIVECSETGGSLRANGLRAVATVLESTIHLIASPGLADDGRLTDVLWLRDLLEGVLDARRHQLIRCDVVADPTSSGATEGMRTVRFVPGPDGGGVLEGLVAHGDVAEVARRLRDAGAARLTVTPVDLYLG
jgi:ATP phosphoribosyltransferase